MIHEEICTYEVCRLAKEKGFNKEVFAYYDYDGDLAYVVSQYRGSSINEVLVDKNKPNPIGVEYTSAPTQCLLQSWLREEKGLHITVPFDNNEFWWQIKNLANGDSEYCEALGFNTYELALEDALKYALENLV